MMTNLDYYGDWKKDQYESNWLEDFCDDWQKEQKKCWKKDNKKANWTEDFCDDWQKNHNECDWKKDTKDCGMVEKFDDECKKDSNKCDKKKDDNHKKGNLARLCAKFADILASEILPSPRGVCVVTRTRDIDVKIKCRPTRSPLVLNALFSFESLDQQGRALNLGETVILQEEINPFIKALKALGIKVTALHNHWLFENPRLFYIHFLSVEEPLIFAKKVARAFEILENCD